MTKSDLQAKAGPLGATAAVIVFTVVAVAVCLLEASFRTWAVGQYFENRAGIFVNIFTAAALCSVITLTFSCFGRGRSRIVGILSSIASLALVIFIFGTNK
jgi:hypothetical protein